MKNPNDNAGIHIPPPLFYVVFFIVGIILQNLVTINNNFFQSAIFKIFGAVLLIAALMFLVTAISTFLKNKTTLLPMKPASALQTSGIYSFTRNPMYLGILFIYLGLTLLIGNWWHFILVPFLIFTVQKYIIIKEEKYLERAFGEKYINYKSKVRRWI